MLANLQVRGVLAELGLAAAIDNEIRQHPAAGDAARIELHAGASAQLQRWPADIEYAVFMIAREALLHALHLARARHIRVTLDGAEGHLELSVSDDGPGFAPPEAGAARLGLVGMRERALAIGARLRVDGPPGHGTMVALTWEQAAEAGADEPHLPD